MPMLYTRMIANIAGCYIRTPRRKGTKHVQIQLPVVVIRMHFRKVGKYARLILKPAQDTAVLC